MTQNNLCKMTKNFSRKGIDKLIKVWYNIIRKKRKRDRKNEKNY